MTIDEIRDKRREYETRIREARAKLADALVDIRALQEKCPHPTPHHGQDRWGYPEMDCPDCGKST